MKTLMLIIFIAAHFVQAAGVKKSVKAEATKMDLDQVWTFSFEELEMIPDLEKEEFSQNLVKEAHNNEVLKKIKETNAENTFKTIWLSQEKWDLFESKINQFCQDTKNYSSCVKIGDVRVNLLNKYSNRK